MPTDRQSGSLGRNADFLKLWFGQSVSQNGSRITFLALPLVAVLTLDATAFQMGLLAALNGLPSLVIGPVAGVYIDRFPRRPFLLADDWGRALLIGSVPLAFALNSLHIGWLYAVALGTSPLP